MGGMRGSKVMVAFCLAILSLMIASLVYERREDNIARKIAATEERLSGVASASGTFRGLYGRWPESIQDLMRQGQAEMSVGLADDNMVHDGWGNPIIYVPYDEEQGHGVVLSYGGDGMPGGQNRGEDLILRFKDDISTTTNGRDGGGDL